MARFIRPASRFVNSISSVPALKIQKRPGYNSFSTYEETLLKAPPTRLSQLDNGLRVASEDSGSKTATIGLFIDIGSKSETDENNGVANFVEHMAFKGTKKRSQADLELEVGNLGAQLTACTSREQTVFYAKCSSQDVPKIVEILSDIIQNSTLGEEEIEKQRSVILHEIEEVGRNLQQVVCDHLHSIAFQGTPLGRSVIGSTESIKSLKKEDLVEHINNFKAPRIVLAGAGGVKHDDLVGLAEEHFKGPTLQNGIPIPEEEPCRFTGSEVRDRDDALPLAHVAIAFESVGWSDPDNLPLMVANTIMGSWDRTHGGGNHNASRLAQAGVEGKLSYAFQSFNTCYKDIGLWGIYFVCDRLTIDDFVYNIQEELMHLCTNVTEFEIARAKNTLRTNLLLQLDGNTAVCQDIGRQVLYNGRRIPFHEIDAQIQAISVDVVRDACYRILYDRCPAVAAVGPVEQLPDYNRVRSGQYWLRL